MAETTPTGMDAGFPGRPRRHVLTLAAAVGLLVLAHAVVADETVRYGAYLVVFSLWMVWFVQTVVDWFRALER